jgi:glycogen(starch) synthase
MNVALFASAFHPHVGGVEELVRQLAHSYRAQGMDAIVVTNQWPPDLPTSEDFEGIPVYRLPMRAPEGSLKVQAKYYATHGKIRREMLDILTRHQITLLHVQCVSINGYYAHLAHKALKLPLIVTAQGERTMDADHIYEKSPFLNQTLRILLGEAAHITACSRDTLSDIETFFGQPFGARASVVYNGIRLADFADPAPYQHPRPYLLGIGRHVPQKGFDVLLRAFAEAHLPEHDLLLAGDGPERPALEALASALNLGARVQFVGRADRPTAVSLFQGCDFFVLPSRMEPQGIVNLEAMAAGKAVVASRVGGVPDIVLDNETGLLVPGEDVPALASAITRLAADSALRQTLGDAGRKRAQGFDWSAIAAQYLEIYQSVPAVIL